MPSGQRQTRTLLCWERLVAYWKKTTVLVWQVYRQLCATFLGAGVLIFATSELGWCVWSGLLAGCLSDCSHAAGTGIVERGDQGPGYSRARDMLNGSKCRRHHFIPTSFWGEDVLRLDHKARAPVLPLVGLLIDPQHALAEEVIQRGPGAGPCPVEVGHQHGDADVPEHLHRLEDRALVRVQLLWY